MPRELDQPGLPGEWTIPVPVRVLLWWPPVAFLLVLVVPQAAAAAVAVAGAVLAALGVAVSAVSRRARRPQRIEPLGTPDQDELVDQRAA